MINDNFSLTLALKEKGFFTSDSHYVIGDLHGNFLSMLPDDSDHLIEQMKIYKQISTAKETLTDNSKVFSK